MIDQRITLPMAAIAEFCERNHIRKLSLFGSVLRDDFRPDSDIDVLVEFEPGVSVGLFKMGEMQMDLSDLLGRSVDFKTEGFINSRLRQKILNTARVLYERN